MTEILNGPPQFILLVLVTGMIAFYSQVLNKVIAKRKSPGHNADVRLVRLSRWLVISEIALLFAAHLIVIRIFFSIFMWDSPTLDLIAMIMFALAQIALTAVFCVSYFSKEPWKWLW